MQFDETTQKNVDTWLNGNYDKDSKDEIRRLIKQDPQQIVDAFYTRMAFGTGGLRGLMGPGTNRMNQYTIASATQGLSNYINLKPSKEPHSVLIGHDSRNNSPFFSEVAAKVFAANNIRVYIYREMRPVPMVSFGCRHQNCTSAIMITASHNPPQYNGYKVYWNDGAQVLPPHDEGIIKEVYNITDLDQIRTLPDMNSNLIHYIDDRLDHVYLDTVRSLQQFPGDNKFKGERLKVVYTPLHGSGITMVPKIIKDWGFSSLSLVEKQAIADGNFPTVEKPNPEEEKAMKMGIKQLLADEADILLGTDPDCDRIGVAVLHQCKAALLSGNEMACICAHHLCEALEKNGKMPENAAFVKTIVTSELFKAIVESYKKTCFDVLTGFKYIGQLIYQWKQSKPATYQYIFGGEESYGYLLGTHSRDKDAIIMSSLICEVALQAKLQGKTLIDVLHEIYKKHGIYREKLISVVYPDSKETKDNIQKMMENLRTSPPKSFAGKAVKTFEDYQASIKTDLVSGKEAPITLPKSNVLLFWLEDGSKLVIRPSGTEPKVKIYCGVVDQSEKNIEQGIKILDERIELLTNELRQVLS
ncbi:MAG: Phosphoglucomutase [Chlamydiae bacterium]|nr:Phosphoglucomutase [Chlamydiota bacterium]